MTDTTTHEADASSRTSIPDPERLRERDDVPVVETERVAPPEAFAGVRANYADCEGVVVVGVVDDDRLLLLDDEAPGPVRGDVAPGEGWAPAARRVVAELTGVHVAVEGATQVEFTTFVHAEADERFTVPTVDVLATPAGEAADGERAGTFREDPQVLADPDHKYHDDGAHLDLGWHDDVPDEVHPNHADDVRRFLAEVDA